MVQKTFFGHHTSGWLKFIATLSTATSVWNFAELLLKYTAEIACQPLWNERLRLIQTTVMIGLVLEGRL